MANKRLWNITASSPRAKSKVEVGLDSIISRLP